MRKWLAVACVVLIGGCGSSLVAGAERVQLVSSESAVRGMRMVNSTSGTCGVAWAFDLPTRAQNFGKANGADVVLTRQSTAGNQITYTWEAWKR